MPQDKRVKDVMTPMDKVCPKSSVPDCLHIPGCTCDPCFLLAGLPAS